MVTTKTAGKIASSDCADSRLHHLSTWKAELRVLVAAAQRQSEELSLSGPSNSTISPLSLSMSILPRAAPTDTTPGERIIFHVDFDCFFVSCGLATRPHLKGRPCVVCHSQAGRGASSTSEIASASYEARAKGVKNGMSLGRARALVGKDLQTIPYVTA
jgi:DNA repair protein REV1